MPRLRYWVCDRCMAMGYGFALATGDFIVVGLTVFQLRMNELMLRTIRIWNPRMRGSNVVLICSILDVLNYTKIFK